ncbi:MAG: hydroxymethylbilane synthase [Solirubrobacterales bacterium]|nr:hydroxymethylbilane synthase [Solirubrobacterales bacterium]
MSPAGADSLAVASRPSPLALAQATLVTTALGLGEEAVLTVDSESGPADKERFVRGVEQALLAGRADLGVHSAKDLPGEMTTGLVVAAVPERADARDAWIGPGCSVEEIPEGARVGTSSPRRRAQLMAVRPDLVMVEMAGNVDTRLEKLGAGDVDGLVLAMAGLERLGRAAEAAFAFDPEAMVPAAGQGALVVQGRVNGTGLERAAAISDEFSFACLEAERAAVVAVGAGCDSPVGFHATCSDTRMAIDGFAGRIDGSAWLRDRVEGDLSRPAQLGRELAGRMLAAGAAGILADTVGM